MSAGSARELSRPHAFPSGQPRQPVQPAQPHLHPVGPPRGRSDLSPGPPGSVPARLGELRRLVQDVAPVTFAHERTLPVLPAIQAVLGGGLRRGSSVRVEGGPGATALALAVAAGPSRAGSWVACVGMSGLGWEAAAELGLALERVAVIRAGERNWATVVAALVDAVDVVLVGPEHRPSDAEARRLTARARERGSVLMSIGAASAGWSRPDRAHRKEPGHGRRGQGRGWPGADVRLSTGSVTWWGPGEGWGHLRARRVTVHAEGRGGLDRPRRVDLWLPGPGGVEEAELLDGTERDGELGGTERDAELGGDAGAVLSMRRRAG